MGMDLYKYAADEKNGEFTYIGVDLTDKELSYFEKFDIKTYLTPNMDKIENICKEIFNEDLTDMFYDFSDEFKFILKLNDDLIKKIDKEIYFINDIKERETAEKYQEELIQNIENDIAKYSQENEKINIDSGILYIFKNIPIKKDYYISHSDEELGYMRKPFRDCTDQNRIESKKAFFSKASYNKEESILVFTNKHNVEKEFLAALDKYSFPFGEKLFPLKDNEFIAIDW